MTIGTSSISSGMRSTANPAQERFSKKISTLIPTNTTDSKVNWDKSRVVTPGNAVGFQTSTGIKLLNGEVKLFKSGEDSQALIKEDGQVVAASVTTKIKAKTKRKEEKKSTFIQYDKTAIDDEDKDFDVTACNSKGKTNYQGCHFIDYKFGAQDSHTTEENYYPGICTYNSPIKEYLVRRSEAYVEIRICTPNPPTIGIAHQKGNSDPIPIGVVFIQINNKKFDNIYFFPNNDTSYEELKEKLKLKKDIAKTLIPFFRLKTSLIPFFHAAIITDIKKVENGQLIQSENEALFFKLANQISIGMSLADYDDEAEEVSQIAFTVLHQSDEIDPRLFLDCTKEQWKVIKGQSLKIPFKFLGEFVIKYGLRNSLKSEVLSIQSRLVIASVIIDFIQAYDQVTDEALEFVDSLTDEFNSILKELAQIRPTMQAKELFFYANLYQRLSDSANHEFSTLGYQIYNAKLEDFFFKFIKILKAICDTYEVSKLKGDFASHFLELIRGAQDTFNYLIETYPGLIDEWKELKETASFLKDQHNPCLKLLKKEDHSKDEFQSNTNEITMVRSSPAYLESFFSQLGLPDTDVDSASPG